MKDLWGRRLFKTGGALLVFLGLVHSLSFLHPIVPTNDTEKQLLDLMGNYRFDLMGSARSMAELLQGFSISFTLSMLGVGILDLLPSREPAELLKRVALVNILWLAAMTANSLRHFFLAPTSFLAAALLIFAAARLKLPADGMS